MQVNIGGKPPYDDSQILLSYQGTVTDGLFDAILELAEHKLDQEQTSSKVKRRVFKILVESLQNVYHHFDNLPGGGTSFPVSFSLEKHKLAYSINTGNHISVHKVKQLKSFIDRINNLSSQELKSLYRERLGNSNFTDGGGAGLGIVDILRKSGEKITYGFRQVNKDYSYFSLKVKVSA